MSYLVAIPKLKGILRDSWASCDEGYLKEWRMRKMMVSLYILEEFLFDGTLTMDCTLKMRTSPCCPQTQTLFRSTQSIYPFITLICLLGPCILHPSSSPPRLKPPLKRSVRLVLNRSAPLSLKWCARMVSTQCKNGFGTVILVANG